MKPVEVLAEPVAEEKPAEVIAEPVVEEKPVEPAAEPVAEEKPAESVVEEKPVELAAEPVAEEKPVEPAAEMPVEMAAEPVAEEKPAEPMTIEAVETPAAPKPESDSLSLEELRPAVPQAEQPNIFEEIVVSSSAVQIGAEGTKEKSPVVIAIPERVQSQDEAQEVQAVEQPQPAQPVAAAQTAAEPVEEHKHSDACKVEYVAVDPATLEKMEQHQHAHEPVPALEAKPEEKPVETPAVVEEQPIDKVPEGRFESRQNTKSKITLVFRPYPH